MDQAQINEILAAIAEQQDVPKNKPQPRRVLIYLDSPDRPEIHGRPMSVHRADVKEWVAAGLAQERPFVDGASRQLVQPTEYRRPEAQAGAPTLVWNVNAGRFDMIPTGGGPPSPPPDEAAKLKAELEQLKAELAAAQAAAKAEPAVEAKTESDEEPEADVSKLNLPQLRKLWAERNPDESPPPAAKAPWFRKALAEA